MNILYIDPIFGISGDMMLSALIDAGYPFKELEKILKKIPYPLPAIVPVIMEQGVVKGTHLNIERSDVHLTVSEMQKVIEEIDLEERIKTDARAMLEIILNAEAKVHGINADELHLHELSNIDTLIDFIGVAAGINYFKIDKVYCGDVPCGRGTIKTLHGIIPNPPPVTLDILTGFNIVFYEEPFELTTPTGAAIVRHYVKDKITPPSMRIKKTGYGVGTYKTEKPDVLRIFIGETGEEFQEEDVWVIETDIDDMEMEYVGAVADRIRAQGALDCLYFPVYMKKGRFGIRLSVTTKADNLENLIKVLLSETTTFGMRLRKEFRNMLKREERTISTSFGSVRIKNGYDNKGNLIKTHIEFEDIKRLAEERGIPYRVLLDAIKTEIKAAITI